MSEQPAAAELSDDELAGVAGGLTQEQHDAIKYMREHGATDEEIRAYLQQYGRVTR